MLRHAGDRLAQTLLTLFLLSIIVFFLARVLGDPVMFMMPMETRPEEIERVTRLLGLDRPLHVQYLDFIAGAAVGDLGISVRHQTPVSGVILERLRASIPLAVIAAAWALLASILLGSLAALHRGGALDLAARAIAVVGQSAPAFWVGIMLIELMSVRLELLPSAGIGSPAHIVMPAFTLGLLGVAGMTRLLRSGMIDALDSEYVKKARIMGVSEPMIVLRHCLRNAGLPVLTYAGGFMGQLVAAGVVVEVVFAWPGLGRLAFDAVVNRDYPLIQGVVLVIAAIIMAVNLTVDLLCIALDPRIRIARG